MDFLVYIDTNLGHNFVMIVSDSDTVCDIKGKIVLGYADCFPQMGEINVHAIKIDLRGTSYRLSESMVIGKVFEATIGARLLHVDASSTGPKHNKIRLSENFLITRKENGDRNGTLLRIENNGSHLLQCAPDISGHPNRDDHFSGVNFDATVYRASDSPKMKSKGTKSIITTSGTSQSECGKGIDVPRVQKEVDYSHVLLKNDALAVLGQNGSIEQGKEYRKRKDWEKLTDLQNDNQSEIVSSGPRKKRHKRKKEKEHVDAKFDIDKSQAVCEEILGKKSEKNVLGCTDGPSVIENNIDLMSPNIPEERKKRKKISDTFPSSDISDKHKYSSDITSGHPTLKLTKNDIGIVEKSLANKNRDSNISLKKTGNTSSVSIPEPKNALAAAEKLTEEIQGLSSTPVSKSAFEKEQVTFIIEESSQDVMKRKITDLVLTSHPPASLPQIIPSLSEGSGDFGFQEDVDLVIPSKDDVSTCLLANNDKKKRCKKKKKGKHSNNAEAKNALVAAENVEKPLADKNKDPDIPMKNTENTLSVSSREIKNALVAAEKVSENICMKLATPTSELPCEKREEVTLITMESAQDFMKGKIQELGLRSPPDATAQPGDLETPDFRISASLPQKIPSLSEGSGDFGFQEDVDLVIPSKDDVLTATLANHDKRKRHKKKKKGRHSDNHEAKNALVAAENVEKSLADKNRDPDIPMKNTENTLSVSSFETKDALVAAEKVIEGICRQLTPTSDFSFEKEQVTLNAEESAQDVMNKNNTHLVLTSSSDAITQTGDLETLDFRSPTSLPQQIPNLLGGLGDFGLQEDFDPVIPSKAASTILLVNNDKSERHKRKKCINSDIVEAGNAHVAAKNVDKSLADKNEHPYIPMKNTFASFPETKNALDATDMVIEENCRQSTPSSESPFEKEQVMLITNESAQDIMKENNTELVLTSPPDAKTHTLVNSCISEYESPSIANHISSPLLKNVRKLQKADEHPVKDGCMSMLNGSPLNDTLKYPKPVVGEVNFAEFFLPDIAVAKKGSIASPECTGNRKTETKNGHILNSKYRELQEESITRESKRDLEKCNASMQGSQVIVPHTNVHIPCESTHISKEANLTGIQTRNSHAKSCDKMEHDGVALTGLESQELSDNKSHKVKGKTSLVSKKTEENIAFKLKTKMSKIPGKSNSNVAHHSADAGKETNVFDSKSEGRNECYRIAVRKVPGGLFEKLDSSKTEKPLPFDSLSIFDHIVDNVSKDEDVDNALTC